MSTLQSYRPTGRPTDLSIGANATPHPTYASNVPALAGLPLITDERGEPLRDTGVPLAVSPARPVPGEDPAAAFARRYEESQRRAAEHRAIRAERARSEAVLSEALDACKQFYGVAEPEEQRAVRRVSAAPAKAEKVEWIRQDRVVLPEMPAKPRKFLGISF